MRKSTFDALDTFPILLDPPTIASLACSKICLADLISSAIDTFKEETGKTLTLAQAITLIDDQTEIAQEADYWAGVTLRTVRVRGIDENGDPETTKLVLTFDGEHFAMTEYRDGVDVDGYNLAHSLAEVADQLEWQADAARFRYRMRKEARAARPRKARSSKRAPQPELVTVTA